MDGKDIHVLKKSPNPHSPLRVQVPGRVVVLQLYSLNENPTTYVHQCNASYAQNSGLVCNVGLLRPVSEHSITAKGNDGRVKTVNHPEEVSVIHLILQADLLEHGN